MTQVKEKTQSLAAGTPKRAFGWFGPVSGILFAILLAVAVVLGNESDFPDPADPAAKIAAFEEGRDASSFFGLFALSLFFFLFFLAYLRDRLGQVGEQGAWLVSVLWGSGLLFAAMALLIGVLQVARMVLDDYGADAQVAKTLFVLSWESALVLGPPLAAFGASAAALILRFKVLPLWLGALAVLVFLSGLAPWLGAPMLALWVALASIVLLLEERKRPATASG